MKKALLSIFTGTILLVAVNSYAQNSQNQKQDSQKYPEKLSRLIKSKGIEDPENMDLNDPKQLEIFNQANDEITESLEKPLSELDIINKNMEESMEKNQGQMADISQLLLGESDENKIKSLMFGAQELEDINRAVFALKNGEVFAADKSTINEEQSLTEAEKLKLEQEKKERERLENSKKSYIYLASVMYFSQDNWATWINDKKITSQNNKKGEEFYVEKISPEEVKILWTLSVSKWRILSGKGPEVSPPNINSQNLVEIRFTLKPNQTFVLKLNFVAEGKNVSQAVNKKEAQNHKLQKNEVAK